jgi:hypothetical protein
VEGQLVTIRSKCAVILLMILDRQNVGIRLKWLGILSSEGVAEEK